MRMNKRIAVITACILAVGLIAAMAIACISTSISASRVAEPASGQTDLAAAGRDNEAELTVDDGPIGVADKKDPVAEGKVIHLTDGDLNILKLQNGATIDVVVDMFSDASVIIAMCNTLDSCLKAREVMRPLLSDQEVQEKFYLAIVESFDPEDKNPSSDITYIFGNCNGLDMGQKNYTSTALYADAMKWLDTDVSKVCPDPK